MTRGTAVRAVALAVKALAVALALGTLWLAGAESFQRWQTARERTRFRQEAPLRARIEDGCREAGTSHLHPQYLFFLPFTAAERLAISTDVCGITAEGFRAPGPEQRGRRQLAFLIGGSVAFSDMASSDQTTITSVLNRIQDTYFFVTAGVSGWNSSQELSRVAFQLLDFTPALVVALDGANDAGLTNEFGRRGVEWDGVPAHFDTLHDIATRGTPVERLLAVRDALLPALAVRRRLQRQEAERAEFGTATPAEMRRGAARYVTNLTRMHDLVAASGGRFVAIFQPMAQLHRKLDVPFVSVRELDAFHDAAVAGASAALEFYDFARLFDDVLPVVHIEDGELTPDTVFVDDVHLHDRGNALVAEAIWKVLRKGTPKSGGAPAPPAGQP